MADSIHWIRDDAALAERIQSLRGGSLAVDTESDSLHHYPERICLVQMTHLGRDDLIDPLAGVDLSLLAPILSDPTLPKLLHGADYDLRLLHRDFGLEISGLFDTMVASRLTGERSFGLAALLAKHFDVQLDKRYQRADWSRRPLTPEMETYATMDTRFLEDLVGVLTDELQRLGRLPWAEEEFRRLEGVRFRERDDTEPFRRVKGHGKLTAQAQGVLNRLCQFREQLARRKARPPFRIVSDTVLLALASRPIGELKGLAEVQGLPRNFRSGSGAERLRQVLENAWGMPESDWPQPIKEGRRPRRSSAFEARIKEWKQRRDGIAEGLDLEPSIVASRGLLEGLLDHLEAGREPTDHPDLRRWQWALLQALPGLTA